MACSSPSGDAGSGDEDGGSVDEGEDAGLEAAARDAATPPDDDRDQEGWNGTCDPGRPGGCETFIEAAGSSQPARCVFEHTAARDGGATDAPDMYGRCTFDCWGRGPLELDAEKAAACEALGGTCRDSGGAEGLLCMP